MVDAADPARDAQVAAVERILESLQLQDTPRLLVWNKADRLPAEDLALLLRSRGGVAVSALQRQGLDALLLKADRTLFAEGSVHPLGTVHGELAPRPGLARLPPVA